MTPRDHERLKGVHPSLIGAIESILEEMDADKTPMFVVQGVRTQVEQQAIYAQGRTTKGPNVRAGHPFGDPVTMKNGTTNRSDHQPHDDGFGYAVDCAFVGKQPFDTRHPWEAYGLRVELRGLRWGGRWSHPHDAPHAEYQPSGLVNA